MASSQKRSLHLEKGAWRLEARTTAGILLIIALLGLLSWLCLSQASKVSTAEYRIWENGQEIERLQRENAELLAEIAEMLSVSRLESRARELGYISAQECRYLDVPGYPVNVSGGGAVAAPRIDESAMVVLEEPHDESSGVVRWWENVVSQFATWTGAQP